MPKVDWTINVGAILQTMTLAAGVVVSLVVYASSATDKYGDLQRKDLEHDLKLIEIGKKLDQASSDHELLLEIRGDLKVIKMQVAARQP